MRTFLARLVMRLEHRRAVMRAMRARRLNYAFEAWRLHIARQVLRQKMDAEVLALTRAALALRRHAQRRQQAEGRAP